MHKLLVPFFLFLFCIPSLAQKAFDEQALEYKAEIEGYGYKTSNLALVDEVVRDAALAKSIAPYQAQVPDFMGLTSVEVQDLLKGRLDILKRWHSAVSRTMNDVSIAEAFSVKTLPGHFVDESNLLASDIETAFNALADSNEPQKSSRIVAIIKSAFSKAKTADEALKNTRLLEFLTRATQYDWRLMARSTGKEDTKKLANAGGNHSEGNVTPDAPSTLRAIGRVIASYFRERSLMQRLVAGDRSLFDVPLTPVLLQRMIGETLGGDKDAKKIPTGCVVYTEEPSAKVKDIQVLQCSFGHNAGVVDSLVPLDTFYVRPGKALESIVKTKSRRIVPIQEKGVFGLGAISNPKEIQKIPSLSKEAALAIATVSRSIDSYYNERMDIELAYEPVTKTIFIVQARPLVYPLDKETPSYVAGLGQFADKRLVHLSVVYPKDSAVEKITDKKQVLTAATLDQALSVYTDKSFNKSPVVAVVVSGRADATSHAAATFRGEGKMIFVTNEMERLRKWLDAEAVDMLIDAQQGLAIDLVGEQAAAQIKKGWINYPLPPIVSPGAHQEEFCVASSVPAGLGGKVQCLTHRLADQVDDLHKFTETTRTKANCTGDAEACIKERLIAQLALPELENLNTHAYLLLKEVQNKPSEHISDLAELFVERMLDALVEQPVSNESGAYSFSSVKAEYEGRKHLVVDTLAPKIAHKTLPASVLTDAHVFELIELGAKAALTDEVTTLWIDFVNAVSTSGSDLQKGELSTLTTSLRELDLLTMWINSWFAQEAKSQDALTVLSDAYGVYEASSLFLHRLADYRKALDGYDLSVWEDPAAFEKNRASFKESFTNFFTSDDFVKPKTELAQMATVAMMGPYVDTFDQTIKTLKGSSKYANVREKVTHFKLVLEDYFAVLRIWSLAAPNGLIVYHADWPLETYLEKVNELLFKPIHWYEGELFPSPRFSVAASVLGSATAFGKHIPVTLEDMFTLIHQSLNALVGAQVKNVLKKDLVVPKEFDDIYVALSKREPGSELAAAMLTSISLSEDGIVYGLNIPLRDHSERLELRYNKKEQGTSMKIQFLGDDEGGRWTAIDEYTKRWVAAQNAVFYGASFDNFRLTMQFDGIEKIEANLLAELNAVLCETSSDLVFPERAWNLLGYEGAKSMINGPNLNWQLRKQALEYIAGTGTDPEVVEEAATEILLNKDSSFEVDDSLDLFQRLFDHGQGFEAAEKVATRAILPPYPPKCNFTALKLFSSLVVHGRAFEAAEKAATQAALGPYESLNIAALEIFSLLVAHDRAFEAAEKAVAKNKNSLDYRVKNSAEDLLKTLNAAKKARHQQ